jgi:hypothetical protein
MTNNESPADWVFFSEVDNDEIVGYHIINYKPGLGQIAPVLRVSRVVKEESP